MALQSTTSMLVTGRNLAGTEHVADKFVKDFSLASSTPWPAFKLSAASSVDPLIQQMSVSKLQIIRSRSLRLGAAEEGVSSWKEKLDSTLSAKGDLLEGTDSEPESVQTCNAKAIDNDNWRDRVLDEEGNIDNIEQEQTNYAGRGPYEVLGQREQSQRASAGSSALESPSHESSVKDGEKAEAVVKNPQVLPLEDEKDLSETQLEERHRFGWSEASCDEGSLVRRNTDEEQKDREEGMQEDKLQQLEKDVFEGDVGRTPGDYHRRADLFGKSAEQFAVQKQRDESQNPGKK